MFVAAASVLFGSVGYGQSDPPAANSGGLDFKQFGLLAIQDGGTAQADRYVRARNVDPNYWTFDIHR